MKKYVYVVVCNTPEGKALFSAHATEVGAETAQKEYEELYFASNDYFEILSVGLYE